MKTIKREQTDKEKAASKKGKAARVKGKRGEKEWADWLKVQLDRLSSIEVLQRNQFKWSGKHRPEVAICVKGNYADCIVHFECKWQETLSIHKAVEQAVADAASGAIPVVAHKRSRQDVLVTMRADDWIQIMTSYLEKEWGGK